MWRLLRNNAQVFHRKLVAIYAPTSNVRGLCSIASWQALDNTSIIIKLSLSSLSFFTETNLSLGPAVSYCKMLLHFSPSFRFSSCCPKPDSQLFYTYEYAKISHSSVSPSYRCCYYITSELTSTYSKSLCLDSQYRISSSSIVLWTIQMNYVCFLRARTTHITIVSANIWWAHIMCQTLY